MKYAKYFAICFRKSHEKNVAAPQQRLLAQL
jgi:hypothetical protein